jgi:1-deoxy-D-xylulose-5-phosphate reductoisomerase
VLVHPQQIVHGLVTFRDGSVSAGMAVPDMRVAAAHCLGIDGRLDAPPAAFSISR